MWPKLTSFLRREERGSYSSLTNIPRHVAIIMDGNGRWAKKRGLPRVSGHRAGMKTVKEVTRTADELGVEVLTLYAFSTENWKRPKDEVSFLMRLPQEYIDQELDELIERNVQVRMLGSEQGIPSATLRTVHAAIEKTANNDGLILNFALNYGSRAEIVDMVKQVARQVSYGHIEINDIDESVIRQCLQTKDMTDPDLLIRTKEVRLSNFMLWQLAYTELWFADVHWPDFSAEHFTQAVQDYGQRVRRYGSVK